MDAAAADRAAALVGRTYKRTRRKLMRCNEGSTELVTGSGCAVQIMSKSE